MANASRKTSVRPASSPVYRPLDRSKTEFRLLKIFPPASRLEGAGPLEFSQEPIRCEIQYESLDVLTNRLSEKQSSVNEILAYLLQDIPGTLKTEDPKTDTSYVADLLASRLRNSLSVDEDTVHEIGSERTDTLLRLHEVIKQKLEMWSPDGLQLRPKSFERWLGTWIWTPLSGDPSHLEQKSLGYFALSYVWRDQAQATMPTQYRDMDMIAGASGMTLRQAMEFRGSSPEMIEKICGPADDLAEDSVDIILDGVPVSVGRNLERALRTLREIPEISNGTRVWVDALCINQQDVQEKNFEVKRMGEIYRKADRVVSYLGEESDDSGDILDFMDAIGEVLNRAEALATTVLGFLRNVQADMAFSMAKLLQRTYFTRIWIFQEVALGSQKSIAICGTRRFSWPNLLRCGKMLSAGIGAALWNLDTKLSPTQGVDKGEDYLTLADLKDGITKLQMLRDAQIGSLRQEDEEDEDFRDVPSSNTLWFRIPGSTKATDSRDLVYGMLNLLHPKLAEFINVDYASPNRFVDVMTTFAEAHITSTQSLGWILHRFYSPFLGHQDWPTWVPNLAQRFSSAHWQWMFELEGTACPNIPCEASFAMARDTRKHLLVCKGLKLDIIHVATENAAKAIVRKKMSLIQRLANEMTDENAEESYPMIDYLQRSLTKQLWLIIPEDEAPNLYGISTAAITSTHRYGNNEGLRAALSRCCGRFSMKLEGGESIFRFPLDISEENDEILSEILTSREFKAPAVITFNKVRDVFADFKLWDTCFRDLFTAHAADVEPTSFSAPVIEGNAMMLAHLFTTVSGYVGTCLGNVRAGDEVFLLAGCRMPVLLRKSVAVPGAYRLEGGAYIPGLMNGEALTSEGRSEDDFETIMIC